MNYSKLIILFGLFLFLGLGSCTKKEKETACTGSWAIDLQAKATAISTTAQAYFTTQNSTTCNAYKNACQDYVNALKPYGNCTTLTVQQKSEWQTALNTAEASLAQITCN
jgi:hypothetical protein